jgi:flagellar motor switch protein FliG
MAAKKYTGYEKAAILLMAIGEDAASEVMKNLDLKDVHLIGNCISSLSNIATDDVNLVMREFSESASSADGAVVGGDDYVKKVLTKALGAEKAGKLLENLSSSTTSSLETLKYLDSKTISNFVKIEHPQTIALILTYLDTDHAGEVVTHLPEHLRSEVLQRMAMIDNIPVEIIKELEDTLQKELQQAGSAQKRKVGGIKVVAEILNQMDKSNEEKILITIDQSNPNLSEQIKKLMFVFDDLKDVNDTGMQEILKEVGREDLVAALKGAGETVKEKFTKNMSERASEILKEDMEAKGPIRISEVEKAQQAIIKIAKKLESEGKVVLRGKGGEEMLV